MEAGEDITSFEISDVKTVITTRSKRVLYPKGQYYKVSESHPLKKGWCKKGTVRSCIKMKCWGKKKNLCVFMISIFFSFFNRYGRIPIYLLSCLGVGISGIIVAFSPNFTVFMIFRFLQGMFGKGTWMTCYVIGESCYLLLFLVREREGLLEDKDSGRCSHNIF